MKCRGGGGEGSLYGKGRYEQSLNFSLLMTNGRSCSIDTIRTEHRGRAGWGAERWRGSLSGGRQPRLGNIDKSSSKESLQFPTPPPLNSTSTEGGRKACIPIKQKKKRWRRIRGASLRVRKGKQRRDEQHANSVPPAAGVCGGGSPLS